MGIFENMAAKFVWLFLLISIFSCGSADKENENSGICSKEQIEKFEKCRKNFDVNFEKFHARYPNMKIPDSVSNILKEIHLLSLEEIAKKYKLNNHQIDQLINSVCINKEINDAYKNLEENLKVNDSIRVELRKLISDSDSMALQKYNFTFSKIKSLKIKNSQSGKYFYIDKSDTVFVKVNVAKYEE